MYLTWPSAAVLQQAVVTPPVVFNVYEDHAHQCVLQQTVLVARVVPATEMSRFKVF